jgi:hypothetical protein
MAKDKIEIEVLAKGVEKAQKDVDNLKKKLNDTGKQGKQSGASLVATFASIGAGAAAAFTVIKKGLDMSREFSKFNQSVRAMEAQFGVSADKVISKLAEVSKGTISNSDLVQSANKAMALNVTKDIDQMAQLMEVARIRGQAMGLDTTQAFEDIVTGIGRGCLVPDTLVLMGDGSSKRIIDINTGDIVKSVNKDGELENCEVHHLIMNGHHDVYDMECSDGNIVTATDIHRFYTTEGYKFLKDIKINKDKIVLHNKSLATVIKITPNGTSDVYKISVPKYENFFANGIQNLNSPLILDNLGIITKGWAEEAKAAGQAFDAQFILNKVLADGAEILEKTGDVALTTAERYQKMEADAKNLSLAVGGELQNEFTKILDSFDGLVGGKSPIELIIRSLRFLIATLRITALFFTTSARVSALALTPLAVAVGSLVKGLFDAKEAMVEFLQNVRDFDIKNPIESLKKLGTTGKDVIKSVAENILKIPSRIKTGVTKQMDLMKGELTAAGDSILNIFTDVNTKIGEGEKVLTQVAKEESDKRVEISKDEMRRRSQVLNSFQGAFTNFSQSLIDIEQAKLDRMDKNDTKARKAQKKKLRELAVFQKIIAGVNAGINTAEAVTSALKIDPTGILATAVGIAGALEVAAIAATPIPAFRQGTSFSPSGSALVGEAGPEIVRLPQGSEVIPNTNINNETNDNRNINISVQSPNAIELVNELQQTYGLDVFGGS